MRIVFLSNYLNHHQIPLCKAFLKHSDIEFLFIATEKVPEERTSLGYSKDFYEFDYYRELGYNITDEEIKSICWDADAVIGGSSSLPYIKNRMSDNKLTFLYSEHIFKRGFLNHPGDIWRAIKKFTSFNFKKTYVLCASYYMKRDLRRICFFNKKFVWGYFPQLYEYNDLSLLKNNPLPIVIWVGRFIDWKHPEVFLNLCKELKNVGKAFKGIMIGSGLLKNEIEKYIHDNGLNMVEVIGSMPPEKVRNYMEKADIFVFPSDGNEGWGAVLNEAMNSGCIVIANKKAGASKALIKDGFNGFLYKDGDQNYIFQKCLDYFDNKEKYYSISKNAYLTILNLWNSDIAVDRFLDYLTNPKIRFAEGPMSIVK